MCDPTTYLKQSQEVQGADMEGFMILNIIIFADMERKKYRLSWDVRRDSLS